MIKHTGSEKSEVLVEMRRCVASIVKEGSCGLQVRIVFSLERTSEAACVLHLVREMLILRFNQLNSLSDVSQLRHHIVVEAFMQFGRHLPTTTEGISLTHRQNLLGPMQGLQERQLPGCMHAEPTKIVCGSFLHVQPQ